MIVSTTSPRLCRKVVVDFVAEFVADFPRAL